MEYRRLASQNYPRLYSGPNQEVAYWEGFGNPIVVSMSNPISSVVWSPANSLDLIFCSSTKIQLYSASGVSKRQFGKTKENINTASFRGDGKLIIGGGDNGIVYIYGVEDRSSLRSLKGHAGAVRCARFHPSRTEAVSCSDDTTIKLWDIPTATLIGTCLGHLAAVRAVNYSGSDHHLVASGSHDTTVKLWDWRTQQSVMTMEHEAPVEQVLVINDGSIVVSAGSNYISLWDTVSGGRLLKRMVIHRGNVTCLTHDRARNKLLTGSHDQTVKTVCLEKFEIEHSIPYPAPISSIALSPIGDSLALGTVSGLLLIQTRKQPLSPTTQVYPPKIVAIPGNRAGVEVGSGKLQRIEPYDLYLKKFQYRRALDKALETGHTEVILSLLEELSRRDGLDVSLSGRNLESLQPIARFVTEHLTCPQYSRVLVSVCKKLLNNYEPVAGQSIELDAIFDRLGRRLGRELEVQQDIVHLLGIMKLVLFNHFQSC